MQQIIANRVMPTHAQCALNGQWETALVMDGSHPPPEPGALHAWLGGNLDFALEIFFDAGNDKVLFAGLRLKRFSTGEVHRLISSAAQTIGQCRAMNRTIEVRDFFNEILGSSEYFHAPDFVEIGVNNLWKSVGSCVIWKNGEDPVSASQAVSTMSALAPQLLTFQPSNVMLEVAFDQPISHWIGMEISQKIGDEFRLDTELLDGQLKRIALE